MSLLLDALKKAADDKKASKAENDSATAQADTARSPSVPEQQASPSSPSAHDRPAQQAHDDVALTLEPIDQPHEAVPASHAHDDVDAPELELSLDEPQAERPSAAQAEHGGRTADTERRAPVAQEAMRDTVQETAQETAQQPGQTENRAEPVLKVSPAVVDRGGDRTVSDEALNMLIYNSNRAIRRQRIATVTSMVIISLLVLLSGGFYFYTDMQAEIASLERQHRNAMQAMQAKTNSEQAPKQSEIIRNLVSDKDLGEKVQFAREKMSDKAQAASSREQKNTARPVTDKQVAVSEKQPADNRRTGTVAAPADYSQGRPSLSIEKTRRVDPIEKKLENAWHAYDTGELQLARRLYGEVLSVEPESRDALLGIGAIAIVEGDQPAAIDAYFRLLEIDPTDPIASAALSDLRTSDSNAKEVERYLVNMLQKNPKSPPLNFAIGNFYARKGQWHDAQAHYFVAWENDGDNADYLFNLAVSMDQLNKPEQALVFYRDSLTRAGDRKVGFSREAVRKRIAALSE